MNSRTIVLTPFSPLPLPLSPPSPLKNKGLAVVKETEQGGMRQRSNETGIPMPLESRHVSRSAPLFAH